MGVTIHEDNIRSVLNDPPNVVMSEVLCRWVVAIQNIVDAGAWNKCLDKSVDLDPEKLTWLAIDLLTRQKTRQFVGAQKLPNESICSKAAAQLVKRNAFR
jgi:hypothetical protein